MLFSEIFNGGGGSGANLWISGVPVPQWGVVVSPLDGEAYRRITATGASATDPADDTENYVAISYQRVGALTTIAEVDNGSSSSANFANGAAKLNLNLGVGARTSVLSVTGRGALRFLGLIKANSDGGRIELLIDGRVVFDGAIAVDSVNTAAILVGTFTAWTDPGNNALRAYIANGEAGIEFKRSLQVFYTPLVSPVTTGTLAYMLRETR